MGKEWTKPMQWDNEGSPPSESLVKNGFQAYYKPPANIFNYFLNKIKTCIEELQDEADSINDAKATKAELTAANSELQTAVNGKAPTNHAAAATTYGAASASEYGHAKASSTTPKANGKAAEGAEASSFARGDHVHPMQEAGVGIATAGTGAAYTATVASIAELKAGVNFMMVPHTVSTAVIPTLNVNGLGAKNIRRRLSGSTTATVAGSSEGWIAANKPVRMSYDGTNWIADVVRPDANDIYGSVDITHGGHGGTTAEEARANLGCVSMKSVTVTLPAANWAGGTQTVKVSGVTSDAHKCHVFATHHPESYETYRDSYVRMVEQCDGALTFACEAGLEPAVDIQVNVAVFA